MSNANIFDFELSEIEMADFDGLDEGEGLTFEFKPSTYCVLVGLVTDWDPTTVA